MTEAEPSNGVTLHELRTLREIVERFAFLRDRTQLLGELRGYFADELQARRANVLALTMVEAFDRVCDPGDRVDIGATSYAQMSEALVGLILGIPTFNADEAEV